MESCKGGVGVGTTVPGAALDINGQIKIQGGTPGSGKVLTSDAAGLASWTTSAVVTQATTSANGYLASTDWNTFNNKVGSLNGLSGGAQTFAAVGTAGTAPAWSSSGSTHTLNIPMASTTSVTAGLLAKSDWTTFNSKQPALGYTPVNKADDTISGMLTLTSNGLVAGTSQFVLANGNVGVGTTNPSQTLTVAGTIQSTSGGVMFPDGSVQVSASPTNLGVTTLTDAATITVNGATGSVFKVTLGGNRGLANPTNLAAGINYSFIFIQDATGGRALTFESSYIFPTSVGTPTLSTGAGMVDTAQFLSDGTYLYYLSGFANASTPCLAPTNVTVATTVGSSVTTDLTWIDPNSNSQNDIIQRSVDGATGWVSLITAAKGITSAS